MNLAIVVPTIRSESYAKFEEAWQPIFNKHKATVYKVIDGDTPKLEVLTQFTKETLSVENVMGSYAHLIYNRNDGVRNLGFAAAYKDGADVIITLDDDTLPIGDPIADHLAALDARYPISWINTTDEVYMRGFPYGIRDEAECVLSHGTWQGVADFDASTQLVLGTPKLTNRRMPIPKGVLYPMCIMNVAFKRCLVPYFYQAPAYGEYQRFSDIWCGIESKLAIDEKGWCAVTGYAEVQHNRASNAFTNLKKEATGVGANEGFWKGDFSGHEEYFLQYQRNREEWYDFIKGMGI